MNAGPMVTGSLVGSALTLGIAGPAAAAAGAAAAWGEEIGSMAVGGRAPAKSYFSRSAGV